MRLIKARFCIERITPGIKSRNSIVYRDRSRANEIHKGVEVTREVCKGARDQDNFWGGFITNMDSNSRFFSICIFLSGCRLIRENSTTAKRRGANGGPRESGMATYRCGPGLRHSRPGSGSCFSWWHISLKESKRVSSASSSLSFAKYASGKAR